MDDVSLLDCTLRDGGYVNGWNFKNSHILAILKAVNESGVENIECGYLNNSISQKDDSTVFFSVEQVNRLLQEQSQIQKFDANLFLMVNYGDYDVSQLTRSENGLVSGIRLAFHKKDFERAIQLSQFFLDKGYRLCLQPMVTMSYSDDDLLRLIELANKLPLYAFYIVDSFGCMGQQNVKHFYNLVNIHLRSDVLVGFHSHNNMQLAYANSMLFANECSRRSKMIDCSVFGMGRGAGNLNTEIFANFLNSNFNKNYNIFHLLEVIDDYLEAVYREKFWGYSVAHFLSALRQCHPNYASFFVNKKTLTVRDIKLLLDDIPPEKLCSFDRDYSEKLYFEFNAHASEPARFDKGLLRCGRPILVLASGRSVKTESQKIQKFIDEKKPLIVAVNHVSSNIESDYFFFSNQKRFDEFAHLVPEHSSLITTTNVVSRTDPFPPSRRVSYHELYRYSGILSGNATILLLNLLALAGQTDVFVAGLDGYKEESNDNYSYPEYGRVLDKASIRQQNEEIFRSLSTLSPKIKIHFLTTSSFS